MKKNYRRFSVLVGCVLACISIFLLCRKFLNSTVVGPNTVRVEKAVASPYTESECYAFFTNHLKPIIVDTFLAGNYLIPEISSRCLELQEMIKNRFGRLSVNIYTGYPVQGNRVLAICLITNGLPLIAIPIPAAIDLYRNMNAERTIEKRDMFNLIMGIVVIHEMEHAAYGYINTNSAVPSTRAERDEYEKRTWALTCEKSLTPLVEKYRKALPSQFAPFYEYWAKVGRNVEHPLWGEFIREVH